jgi:TctA family transporter
MALLLGQVGLMFGLHDYCALMLLGFFCESFVTTGSLPNGLAMTLVGVLLGLVGKDVNSGISRFSFDLPFLMEWHWLDQRCTWMLWDRRNREEPGRQERSHSLHW